MSAIDQSYIREKLKQIRDDANLSEDEKRIQCQKIMYPNSTEKPLLVSNYSKECSHYQKKCSRLVFECCNVTDPCVQCHNNRGCCNTWPPNVSSVTCDECEMIQKPSLQCIQCDVKFCPTFCDICKLWTAKSCEHCFDCDCCRVTDPNRPNFHCFTCECCFTGSREDHQCIAVSSQHEICAYCLSSTHREQDATSVVECCRRTVHHHCLLAAGREGNYRCPHCRKAVFVMTETWEELRYSIAVQPLPESYCEFKIGLMFQSAYGAFLIESIINSSTTDREIQYSGSLVEWVLSDGSHAVATLNSAALRSKTLLTWLWCNECEKKSIAKFHFLGLECKHCEEFNTIKV